MDDTDRSRDYAEHLIRRLEQLEREAAYLQRRIDRAAAADRRRSQDPFPDPERRVLIRRGADRERNDL